MHQNGATMSLEATKNVPAHSQGWPFWTATISHGRSTVTPGFWSPNADSAAKYAAKYADDLGCTTGKKVAVLSVART